MFENGAGTVCGDVVLNENYAVPAGYSLHIPANASLSGSGTLTGGGTFTADLSEDMVSLPTDLYYNGQNRSNDIKTRLSDGLTQGIAICGQTFAVSGGTVEVSRTDDLHYTATYTNESDTTKNFTKPITLQQSGTTLDGAVKTYNGETETKDFTASDTITVKATPTATGQTPANSAMFAASFTGPGAGQMAVFVGDMQVSEAVDAGADSGYTMTVSAADVLTNGQAEQDNRYTLIVRFVENTNMAGAEAQVEVTVTPNPLTEGMVTLSEESATYDCYEHKPVVTVDGLDEGTDYEITYSSQDFTNAGTVAITVTGKGIYAGTVEKTFTIEKATLTVSGTCIATGTYGAKLSALTIEGNWAVNSPSGSGVPGRWTLTGDTVPNVGDSREYTATFIPVSGAENYKPLTARVTLDITKAPLTITGADVAPRAYKEGNRSAETQRLTFRGLVNGETLTIGEDYFATGAFSDENAGENKTVTVTPFLADNDKAGNYRLADSSFQTTGTISKAPWDIQVTGVPDELTYGDTFTLHSESGVNWSASGGATVDSAGNVTVTGAGEITITATKPGDENHEDTEYPIYLYSGRKALTISGAVGGKAYDGTNEAEITGVTLEGIMGDDDVSVNTVGLTGTLNGSDVGTYTAVTLPRLTLTGGAASNYILSQLPGAVPASVTIRKAAPLTPKTGDLADALLLGGKLDNHLADTNQQAEDMFSQLVKQMAAQEGIPLGPAHCQLIADVQRLLRVQLPRGERLADLIAQHVGAPLLLPARDGFVPDLAQKKLAAGGEGVALVGADQGPVQGLFRVLTVVEAVRQGGQNRLALGPFTLGRGLLALGTAATAGRLRLLLGLLPLLPTLLGRASLRARLLLLLPGTSPDRRQVDHLVLRNRGALHAGGHTLCPRLRDGRALRCSRRGGLRLLLLRDWGRFLFFCHSLDLLTFSNTNGAKTLFWPRLLIRFPPFPVTQKRRPFYSRAAFSVRLTVHFLLFIMFPFLLLNSLSNLFDKLTVAPLRKSEEIHCSSRGHVKP